MRSQWSITLNLPEGPRIFNCEVLQRRGTRSMRLRMRTVGKLLLTCPPRLSLKAQQAFIVQQTDWIASCMAKSTPTQSIAQHLEDKPVLAGADGPVKIAISGGSPRSQMRFNRSSQIIDFKMDERTKVWERDFKHLLLRYAKQVLPLRVDYWVKQLQLERKPKRVSVRDQSSRWGSCSQKATLSLNWRLVLLPQHLADYIILHELAHLREMNHSTRFWQYLRELDPDTDAHEAELKTISHAIIEMGQE
jgi:predicted metal-dependent hydrolase